MIVITTPTGQIGRELVSALLADGQPVRLIARDPARLVASHREGAEVVTGSHDDPEVLDRALAGADALFWLVPPDPRAESAHSHYLSFARAGAEAIRRHGVGHVVAVSSAGHGWSQPAGILSAAFAMDAELRATGVAYRSLSMPFYLENLLRQIEPIRDRGAFSLTYPADVPMPTIATGDIAQSAAGLLGDRSWGGQEDLPVFGPDRLSPNEMAAVMSDVLDRPVAYHQVSVEDYAAMLAQRGASEQAVRDVTEMVAAQEQGIYDADWAAASPTATDLRRWTAGVLGPALDG